MNSSKILKYQSKEIFEEISLRFFACNFPRTSTGITPYVPQGINPGFTQKNLR